MNCLGTRQGGELVSAVIGICLEIDLNLQICSKFTPTENTLARDNFSLDVPSRIAGEGKSSIDLGSLDF